MLWTRLRVKYWCLVSCLDHIYIYIHTHTHTHTPCYASNYEKSTEYVAGKIGQDIAWQIKWLGLSKTHTMYNILISEILQYLATVRSWKQPDKWAVTVTLRTVTNSTSQHVPVNIKNVNLLNTRSQKKEKACTQQSLRPTYPLNARLWKGKRIFTYATRPNSSRGNAVGLLPSLSTSIFR